jgi:hypothetical protein
MHGLGPRVLQLICFWPMSIYLLSFVFQVGTLLLMVLVLYILLVVGLSLLKNELISWLLSWLL